jgi:hypothetical protein
MPGRLIGEAEMENDRDWLSRFLEMITVGGTLDYRCFLGAPWRIDFAASQPDEIAYHVILGGSAVLEDPEGSPTRKLIAGDILLFPHGSPRMPSTTAAVQRRSRPASELRSTSFSTRMTEREIASTCCAAASSLGMRMSV